MSEAGTSKHIKHKDLSLADKILVIDEIEKKTLQSTVAKKFRILQSQVDIAISGVKKKSFYLLIIATKIQLVKGQEKVFKKM